MPYLAKISVHPIKSLDAIVVPSTRIMPGGGLEHDRELGLFDADDNYMNGKRNEKVHLLSAQVDWKAGSLRIGKRDGPFMQFDLHTQLDEINEWLTAYFEKPVVIKQNARGGFPDDKNATGPTIIGSATLDEVTSWYTGLARVEIGRRFRANLEISGAPAFWEDQLYDEAESVVEFRIGDVLFHGTNPCQRCAVPTRDTKTSEQYADFSNIFRSRREETLPDWANRSRFNHFYRLAVNTRVPDSEIGKTLRAGDEVVIL
jgi:uncharacterized protein YcbX